MSEKGLVKLLMAEVVENGRWEIKRRVEAEREKSQTHTGRRVNTQMSPKIFNSKC